MSHSFSFFSLPLHLSPFFLSHLFFFSFFVAPKLGVRRKSFFSSINDYNRYIPIQHTPIPIHTRVTRDRYTPIFWIKIKFLKRVWLVHKSRIFLCSKCLYKLQKNETEGWSSKIKFYN